MIQLDVILLFVNFMLNIKNLDSSFQVFCAFNFISKFTTTNQKLKYCNRLADRETFFLSKYPAKRSSLRVLNTPASKTVVNIKHTLPCTTKKMTLKPGVTVTHIASLQFCTARSSEGSKLNFEKHTFC